MRDKAKEVYVPMSSRNTFYRGLGALTSTVPIEDKVYTLAGHILAYESIQRRRQRILDNDDLHSIYTDNLFRRRTSGKPFWFRNVSRKIGLKYNQ